MTDERSAGKRGRLAVKPDGEKYAIQWAHTYLAVLPAPTFPIDVSKGITAWDMLGNDTYGDCGPAAYGHETMLSGGVPTTAEIEQLYLTYTGGQDVGVNLADFLLWLFQQGKIEGFAPVESGTEFQVMDGLKRGIYIGVNLTDADMGNFNNGLPWVAGTPDPNEGHCVLVVKADDPNGNITLVTWGADQIVEHGWYEGCTEERWVFLTKEDLTDAGYAAMYADLAALPQVTVGPAPTPAPTPTPAPPPPVPPVPDPTPPPVPDPTPPPVPVPPAPEGLQAALDALLASGQGAPDVRAWIEIATGIILAGGA